ncbi:MAG: hypothetical protein K6E19_00585 [Lachnospiraceae bacterium]|nr:hypothetical protein [Lachnospiraceae bacterium]
MLINGMWTSQNGNGEKYPVEFDSVLRAKKYGNIDFGDPERAGELQELLKGKAIYTTTEINDDPYVGCYLDQITVQLQYINFKREFGICIKEWPAWEECPMYPDRQNDGRTGIIQTAEKEIPASTKEDNSTDVVVDEAKIESCAKESEDKDPGEAESGKRIYRTLSGELVRSKEEVIIFDRLKPLVDKGIIKIVYEKEHPVTYMDDNGIERHYHPDFYIEYNGKKLYWEHLGYWNSIEYREYYLKTKLKKYWDHVDKTVLPLLSFPLKEGTDWESLDVPVFWEFTKSEDDIIKFLNKDPGEIRKLYEKLRDHYGVSW